MAPHAVRAAVPLALSAALLAALLVLAPRSRTIYVVLDDPAPAASPPAFYRCGGPWCVPDRRDLVMSSPGASHPERIRAVVVY